MSLSRAALLSSECEELSLAILSLSQHWFGTNFLKRFVELTLADPTQGDLKTEECIGKSGVEVLNSAFQRFPRLQWLQQKSHGNLRLCTHTAVGNTEILSEEWDVPSKTFLSHRLVLGPCLFLTQSLTRVSNLSIHIHHLGKLVWVKPEGWHSWMCPRDAHVRGLESSQALGHSDAHPQGDRCPLLLRLRGS